MPTTYLDEGVFSALVGLAKSARVVGDLKNSADAILGLGNFIKTGKFDSKTAALYKSNKAKRAAEKYRKSTSIARASKDLIMSFPTICSDVISPETAAMINKAVERKNVQMIQMIAAAAHLQGYNGQDVIKQIHTNMGINFNVDDYVDAMLALGDTFNESVSLEGVPYNTLAEDYRDAFLATLNICYPLDSLSESSINDYVVKGAYSISPTVVKLTEAKNRKNNQHRNRNNNQHRNRKNNQYSSRVRHPEPFDGNTYGRSPELQRTRDQQYDDAFRRYESMVDTKELRNRNDRINQTINSGNPSYDYYKDKSADLAEKKFKYQKKKDEKDRSDYYERVASDDLRDERDYEYRVDRDKIEDQRYDARQNAEMLSAKSDYFSKQLLDSDVKKANELMPTMIVLRYQVADPDKDPSAVNSDIQDEFIAGVKSRLIAVPSQEIMDRIIDMNRNGVNMNNLIRATSKETSFTRDFLAGIQQAKIDAKKDSKLSKSNPIWRSLQARSNRSRINRLARVSNSAAAITTLIISVQEVESIKAEYNIDLLNPVVASEFMATYNLMALVIVDEQNAVAHFIYDGDVYFEDLAFASLEKDNDRSYKQVVSLLNRIR